MTPSKESSVESPYQQCWRLKMKKCSIPNFAVIENIFCEIVKPHFVELFRYEII
jgi:hypothetical protein